MRNTFDNEGWITIISRAEKKITLLTEDFVSVLYFVPEIIWSGGGAGAVSQFISFDNLVELNFKFKHSKWIGIDVITDQRKTVIFFVCLFTLHCSMHGTIEYYMERDLGEILR